MISPARFLLILSAESNLTRAALVSRELRLFGSARQMFEPFTSAGDVTKLDPERVWYTTKRVLAACLDIGRTDISQVAALVLLTHGSSATLQDADGRTWTINEWLLWNFSGTTSPTAPEEYAKTLPNSPLGGGLPIMTAINDGEPSAVGDEAMLAAARHGWQILQKQETGG